MSVSKIRSIGPIVVSKENLSNFFTPQTNFVQTPSNNGFVSNNINNNAIKINGIRENGIIEKLLPSYGFVQCTDRKGRLFFHFSEFRGELDLLNIGDAVEFQESVDKRTGKPVAVSIIKLIENLQLEVMNGKPLEGLVLTEPKSFKNNGSLGDYQSAIDSMGSVSYELAGETFFLPFSAEDTDEVQKVQAGDKVMFFIAADERNGNLRARKLSKQYSLSEALCHGVVCSMKDNYGFIERADLVKEIFFHFSEYEGGEVEGLTLGDDVEFRIQTRNNKEVAVGITKLLPGTVIFEDVAKEWKRGKIKRSLRSPCGRKQSADALAGRIIYETLAGPIEISFGEKDPVGDFTLMPGDIVEFCIATDRRDKVQHATNIRLTDDTFTISKEKREKGYVTTLKEGFGFIRCTERDARMFFHFSEMLSSDEEIRLQDELEFTIIQDPTNASRQVAIRIKTLSRGSIPLTPQFQNASLEKYTGVVQKEAGLSRTVQNKDPDPGIIMYEVEGTKQMVPYSNTVVDGNLPKIDEKVEFYISECQKNKTKVAINVKVLRVQPKEIGYIVTLKEGFGFIETLDHEKEIYFHFNNFEGDVNNIELGDKVEYQTFNKSGRISAENIRRLSFRSSVSQVEVNSTLYDGRVLRSIHSTESLDYFGLIQLTDRDGELQEGQVYPVSIVGLADRRENIQKGDSVRFQLVKVGESGKLWTHRLALSRKFVQAKVEKLDENGGVLNYDPENNGGKLGFIANDVLNFSDIVVGDEVDFFIYSSMGIKTAIHVKKSCDRPRPERLLSRLKSITDDQFPRVVATRQPKGPDGTKGFKCPRRNSDMMGCGDNGTIFLSPVKKFEHSFSLDISLLTSAMEKMPSTLETSNRNNNINNNNSSALKLDDVFLNNVA